MGDQTFNRMYCDNTTGEDGYGRSTAADDTGSPLVLAAGSVSPAPASAQHLAGAAPSPGDSKGARLQLAPSPAATHGSQQAAAGAEAAPPPNWKAPAFLPPYLQAPAVSGAPSDHPALVHSPDVTGSSLNTLGTRRVSVGMAAVRRASINSRRLSMQDATGCLLADDDLLLSPGDSAGQGVVAEPAQEVLLAEPVGVLVTAGGRGRRRSSGAACESRWSAMFVGECVGGQAAVLHLWEGIMHLSSSLKYSA